jgi:hypothetical protein
MEISSFFRDLILMDASEINNFISFVLIFLDQLMSSFVQTCVISAFKLMQSVSLSFLTRISIFQSSDSLNFGYVFF